MRKVTFSVDIRALPGDNLEDCIHAAIYERKFSQFNLNLCFNGIELLVTPSSTFESLMESWNISKEVRRGIHSTN